MKLKELPLKWRISIISMSITAIMFLVVLILYVHSTIGSLLHVMIG